ncbi:UDP-glucose 4-epimerase GalE [Thiomicrospira microaerophila]|uniref:UDP-glucose 4-epimerase GalE n=1 Tax=Thiomicrospira microaerophila TaxID=406020 RepID=UPI0005C89852|nr:UDP-glucose 4-epimerase GalE [Thiomicrospira microaerophila]
MEILVAGGAGYIGSHMVKMLVKAGHVVTVLDNLSTGHRSLAKYGELVEGDLADTALLDNLFAQHDFKCVVHFAAFSLVGESVTNPAKYYRNNVCNTLNLLDAMVKHDVLNIVFSSTAATYGNPVYTPMDEQHPQSPINPYGASKLMVETLLQVYAKAYGLNSVALRYFNACGADPELELGELHDPETHLIPLVLQAASGRRDSICIFGEDYPTEDGTCVRDYIHVLDLCFAHQLAMQAMLSGQLSGAHCFNLGNGEGFSVKQVIDAAQAMVAQEGFNIKVQQAERREGDPAVLVANADKAKQTLNWQPQYTDLTTILRHAWEWEKKQPGLVGRNFVY